MLSRRVFAATPFAIAGSESTFARAGGTPSAAFATGFAGVSALVPGLFMFPLQLAFIPVAPKTHLSTIAAAFFLFTRPYLGRT